VYEDATGDADWEYRRGLIRSQGYGARTVAENLRRLIDIHEQIAAGTERSKERDDVRGRKIIRDYREANTQAPDDGFVKETWERSRNIKSAMEDLIRELTVS